MSGKADMQESKSLLKSCGFIFGFMCMSESQRDLTHACRFIGVRTPNSCKSEPIYTTRLSLRKPETLQLLCVIRVWAHVLDLSILKDDNLIPEQRKKTGQLGHHRSASHTKGMRIHDRAHGKESGWTNISFNRQNGTSFQEPSSVHLGGKISYPLQVELL